MKLARTDFLIIILEESIQQTSPLLEQLMSPWFAASESLRAVGAEEQ